MLSLSKRECEIAGLLSLGKTEKEVAGELFLSVDTVHTHKKNIFKKTGARSVVDVARVLITRVSGVDVAKLIRENIIEPNAYKVTIMLLFLSLQLVAMSVGMDERTTRVKTVSTRVLKTRKNE